MLSAIRGLSVVLDGLKHRTPGQDGTGLHPPTVGIETDFWIITSRLNCSTSGRWQSSSVPRRRGAGTGEALSGGNQLTAGELMSTIDIEDDLCELQIPTGLPEETYVTTQRGDYLTADPRQGLLNRIAVFQLLLNGWCSADVKIVRISISNIV